ncbi:lymphocyte antigen 6 complex locus protein G6f [Acomys russatus]|uniref:lymphocyte antigen 6 complex locus protein G6f n=1 Tax=Acomys russatus TaxID=60746 RepID=UPI0021E1C588|nr:lymphocyte antigen 6 complex locus protein G6f [Acomys russatus]
MAVTVALLLFLCGLPQAAADSIQSTYVVSGESVELPCPSPPPLHGGQLLTWFRSPAAGDSTILVAQVQVDRPPSDLGRPEDESRFRLLGNYSLLLERPRDGEAGRYWCTVMGQNHKYQNWRVYDVSVLKGSQFSVKSPDGPSCSALLCSVVPAKRLDSSVTWLEGRNTVRGHVQYFWGDGAALLLVCPTEGVPETRAHRPRNIRCLMPQNKRFSFSLAASTEPSPTVCASPPSWDVPWILVLLFTVGQGVIITALSIVLWRRRAQGSQDREPSIPRFKPEVQVYENIHLARLGPPTHKTR